MIGRRGFLLGMGAALAAPSIVKAEGLMKLWVPTKPQLIQAFDLAVNVSDQTIGNLIQYGQVIGRYVVTWDIQAKKQGVRWEVYDPQGDLIPGGIAGAVFKKRDWLHEDITMLPIEPA